MIQILTMALTLISPLLLSVELNFPTEQSRTDCRPMSKPECDMLHAINKIRLRHKLAPLLISEQAARMAREQAVDMGKRGYFSHERPKSPDQPAESFRERVRRFRLRGSTAENIATSSGYTFEASLEQALQGWLQSAGHRRNLLDPNSVSTGIGHYRWEAKIKTRRDTTIQWHDTWVQVFSSVPVEK